MLVATGAHPRVAPGCVPDGERILTWEQVYGMTELPEHLIVVGSGVTGAEFASAYTNLGARVTLVSSRDRVLPGEDADAAAVLEDVFRRRGMTVLSRSRASAVRREGDCVVVSLADGRTVEGSHCLMAVGSIPNTDGLGLEEAGVRLDEGGYVEVDRVSRTSATGVYAAGDCTGVLMLASVAAMQGRIAMWHLLGDAVSPLNLRAVSSNVFTDPEIATVGWTEKDMDDSGATVSLKLPLATNARAKMQGVQRRLREAVRPHRVGHRRGWRRRRATRQRADLPGGAGRRRSADRRPAGPRVHDLPVDQRLGGRGRPPAAHEGLARLAAQKPLPPPPPKSPPPPSKSPPPSNPPPPSYRRRAAAVVEPATVGTAVRAGAVAAGAVVVSARVIPGVVAAVVPVVVPAAEAAGERGAEQHARQQPGPGERREVALRLGPVRRAGLPVGPPPGSDRHLADVGLGAGADPLGVGRAGRHGPGAPPGGAHSTSSTDGPCCGLKKHGGRRAGSRQPGQPGLHAGHRVAPVLEDLR